eukprot:753915-Hanusia_phi.AAC.5
MAPGRWLANIAARAGPGPGRAPAASDHGVLVTEYKYGTLTVGRTRRALPSKTRSNPESSPCIRSILMYPRKRRAGDRIIGWSPGVMRPRSRIIGWRHPAGPRGPAAGATARYGVALTHRAR